MIIYHQKVIFPTKNLGNALILGTNGPAAPPLSDKLLNGEEFHGLPIDSTLQQKYVLDCLVLAILTNVK